MTGSPADSSMRRRTGDIRSFISLWIRLWPTERPRTSGAQLAGVVDDVEPLGNEQIVTVLVAEVPWLVRVTEKTAPRLGEQVSIHFEPSALHLFGPDGTRAS